MPIFRKKKIWKVPGAFGEIVPRYPEKKEEDAPRTDLNDLDELQRMYPNSVRVRCYRCGAEFLISKSPESYVQECHRLYGLNVILDGLCGDVVKKDKSEKNALRDKMRHGGR